MEKLRLELDELRIDSFVTGAPPAERGTVAGHDDITQTANTCHHCTRFGCPGTELC